MNPYPNMRMLQIMEGERGGVPVLPPAGADWGGAPPSNVPPDLWRRTQEVIKENQRKIKEHMRGAKISPPVAAPPGGDKEPAEPCVLPGLFGGCLVTQKTLVFLLVIGVILMVFHAGLLMVIAKPAVEVVKKVL